MYHNIYDVMFLVKMRLSLLSLMSVMTLATVSIERYLALALHLRYDVLITSHLCIVACLSLWVAPLLSHVFLERSKAVVSNHCWPRWIRSYIVQPHCYSDGPVPTFCRSTRHLQQIQDQNNIASEFTGCHGLT